MDVRSWFYSLVTGDAELTALVGTRVYPVNSLETTPQVPFLVYRLSVETPRIALARNAPLQVWVHDDAGDYARIDNILNRVKEVLTSQSHTDNFLEARWLDNSEDLYDDGTKTITRYARFTIVRSQ